MSGEDRMEKLHEKLLGIVRQVDRLCREHNIGYYLSDGTCLGAVRHGGFIPWDDDLDILMTRNDYERFRRVCLRELPDPYFYQDGETDPEYPLLFAKIRDSSTTFLEDALANRNINHGVYVDLFPLDGVPAGKIRRWVQRRAFRAWFYLQQHRGPEGGWKRAVFLHGRRALEALGLRAPLVRAARGLATRYPCETSAEWTYFLGIFSYEAATQPREVFGAPTDISFEGLRLWSVAQPDAYLHALYGDYWTLPPESERGARPHARVFDPERSYREVLGPGREGGGRP